jgi:hypothetical protein
MRLRLDRDLARVIRPHKPAADKRRNKRYWRKLGFAYRGRNIKVCGEYHAPQCLTGLSLGESLTAGDCRNDDNRYSCADVEEVPLWEVEPE